MKVYILSRTRSIKKAFGVKDCPLPVFHTSLATAIEARDELYKRYRVLWTIFEVEARIAREVKKPVV